MNILLSVKEVGVNVEEIGLLAGLLGCEGRWLALSLLKTIKRYYAFK